MSITDRQSQVKRKAKMQLLSDLMIIPVIVIVGKYGRRSALKWMHALITIPNSKQNEQQNPGKIISW